jgi:hypothetical protein
MPWRKEVTQQETSEHYKSKCLSEWVSVPWGRVWICGISSLDSRHGTVLRLNVSKIGKPIRRNIHIQGNWNYFPSIIRSSCCQYVSVSVFVLWLFECPNTPSKDELSHTDTRAPDVLLLWAREFLCLNITLQAWKEINIIPVFRIWSK